MKKIDIEKTISKLTNEKKKFAFLRFALNEILIMDNHDLVAGIYPDGTRQKILDAFAFKDDNYLKGFALYKETKELRELNLHPRFSNENREYIDKDEDYYNSNILHYLALTNPKKFKKFIDKHSGGVFIGSDNLQPFGKMINTKMIIVPDNAHLFIDDILSQIDTGPVLLSLGITSCIIQHKLWQTTNYTTIDIGSIPNAILYKTIGYWTNKNKDKVNKLIEEFK